MLAGPTAVGKGTVAAQVRADRPDIWISVSATTRPARPGEVDGVHYHFVSEDEFDRLVATDGLLEWAVVHGRHRYGTPRAAVEERLDRGEKALLEIDLQGARQVRASMPDALLCFLAPPSMGELERRLLGRGTEDGVRVGPLIDDAYHSNLEDYVTTMKRIYDLQPRVVHGGHFPSFNGERYRALIRAFLNEKGV